VNHSRGQGRVRKTPVRNLNPPLNPNETKVSENVTWSGNRVHHGIGSELKGDTGSGGAGACMRCKQNTRVLEKRACWGVYSFPLQQHALRMNEWLRILRHGIFIQLQNGKSSDNDRFEDDRERTLNQFLRPNKARFDFDLQLWFHLHCDHDGCGEWLTIAWYLNDLGCSSCYCGQW